MSKLSTVFLFTYDRAVLRKLVLLVTQGTQGALVFRKQSLVLHHFIFNIYHRETTYFTTIIPFEEHLIAYEASSHMLCVLSPSVNLKDWIYYSSFYSTKMRLRDFKEIASEWQSRQQIQILFQILTFLLIAAYV